jgi:trimeric autotransporter adhesin
MIPHHTAAAGLSRPLRRTLAGLVAAAGVLLISQPQPARATTGDFEIQAPVGADRAAYLLRGGLQTCDITNHCTGGLTQPKTMLSGPAWANTILQVDTGIPDSGFRGTVSFQLSGLPAGVTSQTAASTTITNSTTLGTDGVGDTIFGTDTTLQFTADTTAPLGNFPLTVTATSGSLSHSVTITVDVVNSLPATTLAQFETAGLQSNPTFGGTPSSATVYITLSAPASGTVVTLVSGDPPVASVPASVTIPAGATSATFTITTQPVTSSTAVSFTASLNGQTIASNQLVVEAPPLVKSLTLAPASAAPVTGGVNGTIILNEVVPENSSGVAVAMSSSNPAAASVPDPVTVTAFSGSGFRDDAFFTITLAPNAPAGPVTISATLNGQTTTAQLTILDQINPSTTGNWGKHDHLLTVTATTNNPSDTLQVFVSGTTQLIGTMTNLGNGNYQGQFPLPVNPNYVDIKSSGGATLTIPIPTVNE